jgi:hypothetical protein
MDCYYNTDNFPNLVGRNGDGWDIYAKADGTRLASIAVQPGRKSGDFGHPLHIASLIRSYPNMQWELTPYGKKLLSKFFWIKEKLETIKEMPECSSAI